MSGERPVPVGTFNSSCASDRNQYLETGELNQRGVGVVGGPSSVRPVIPPGPKSSSARERDSRLSTSVISNVSGYGATTSYIESAAPDFDDRPWSRNGYYERDPPPLDYPYAGRDHRDPYYGHDYHHPHRARSGPSANDGYYRGGRERSYAGGPGPYPGYNGPPEYYPPEPQTPYGMYNTPARGFPPRQPNANQQLKSYLQEFRVRDPARYREWYAKYLEYKKHPDRIPEPLVPGYPPHQALQSQSHQVAPSSRYQQNGDGTRTPVPFRHQSQPHQYDDRDRRDKVDPMSGRSSRAERSFYQSEFDDTEQNETEFERGFTSSDTSSKVVDTPSDRLTPQKFTAGHSIGLITPFGHLLRVSSGSRSVEVLHVKTMMKDLPEYHELDSFPGPLVRGRTHKNTVIKFCQKKIKHIQIQDSQVDKDNLILLWELLILLIKQNGSVVGSDIAELLLKKKAKFEIGGGAESESNNSEVEDEGDEGDRDSGVSTVIMPQPPQPNDPKITQRFCDRLLFGHRNDALEFAMQKGLWGHALFLASKIGDREYGQVMARFANGVAYNHPLQTLYQIMSGRVPSSMTGCMDDAFGDWRPHLAMIISNAGIRPEVEQKAFVTLGDTLKNKNLVFGSQFCHLMAQSTFADDSKLGPLLGLLPDRSNILEATQMTEIYEYAMSLADTHFNLGQAFLRAKFDYVKNLIDYGFTLQAVSYCEVVSKQLGTLGHHNKDDSLQNLRWDLLQVSDRLQYVDSSSTNSDWIQDLRTALLETTDTSETSSRRGSYPSSSVGISSSVDQGSSAFAAVPPLDSNVDRYPQPFPNSGYPPETSGQQELGYGQELPNVDGYDTNSAMYEANPVTTMQTGNMVYNPVSFQPSQPPKFESNQEPWSLQPPSLPQYPEGSGWESTSYFTPQNQDSAHPLTAERKPSMPNIPQPIVSGPNNNIYPPGTFIPTSAPLGNGYPGMDFPSQPSFQPNATAHALKPPQSPAQDLKKKTVRFEDVIGPGGGRMNRNQAMNILRRNESDEVTESEEDEVPKVPPVQFKSTFPIDTPLSRSQPCDDHNAHTGAVGPNLSSASTSSPSDSSLQGQQKPSAQEQKADGKTDGKKGVKQKANSSNTNKGGLLGWLGLRGKNQMILPDDKDPTIVWDEKTKQWVNTREDDDDSAGPRGPPPKDSELMPRSNPPPMGFSATPMTSQGYAQAQPPSSTTVPDGAPSFNPQLNHPVNSPSDGWNQPQLGMGLGSLNYQTPQAQSATIGGPPSLQPPNMNKYQLPKSNSRGSMRGKYVDIFGGTAAPGQTGAQGLGMPPMMTAGSMGSTPMFVPGPAHAQDSDGFQEQRQQ